MRSAVAGRRGLEVALRRWAGTSFSLASFLLGRNPRTAVPALPARDVTCARPLATAEGVRERSPDEHLRPGPRLLARCMVLVPDRPSPGAGGPSRRRPGSAEPGKRQDANLAGVASTLDRPRLPGPR